MARQCKYPTPDAMTQCSIDEYASRAARLRAKDLDPDFCGNLTGNESGYCTLHEDVMRRRTEWDHDPVFSAEEPLMKD
jgi:hypothetical protein